VAGFFLTVFVFSFGSPLLFGIESSSVSVVGPSDVVVLAAPYGYVITDEMVSILSSMDNVSAVSPEIIFSSVVNGRPVIFKAPGSEEFFRIEGMKALSLPPAGVCMGGTLFLGRTGLSVGDVFFVPSPVGFSFLALHVAGSLDGSLSDFVVLNVSDARFLLGIEDGFTLVRVLTSNPAEVRGVFNGFFNKTAGTGESSGGSSSGESGGVGVGVSVSMVKRYVGFFGGVKGVGMTESVVLYGRDTVRAAVLGLEGLLVLLVVMGVAVMVVRGVTEARWDLGVLKAIGASKWRIRLFFVRDLFILFSICVPPAVFLGFSLAWLVGRAGLLYAFGVSIVPSLSFETIGFVFVSVFVFPIVAWFLSGERALDENPASLLSSPLVEGVSVSLEDVFGDMLEGCGEDDKGDRFFVGGGTCG